MNNKNLHIFHNFIKSNEYLLKKGDNNWPTERILYQLSYEHAEDSPITQQAEKFINDGRVAWPVLLQRNLKKKYYENPNIQTFTDHTSVITNAHIINENKILTSSWDGTLRIWNLNDGSSKALKGHANKIVDCALLNKNLAYSISTDGTIRFWDLVSGESKKFVFKEGDHIFSLSSTDFKISLLNNNQVLIIINTLKSSGISSGIFIFDLESETSKFFEGSNIDLRHIHIIDNNKLLYFQNNLEKERSLYLKDFKTNTITLIENYQSKFGYVKKIKNNTILFYEEKDKREDLDKINNSTFWVLELKDQKAQKYDWDSKIISNAWFLNDDKVFIEYKRYKIQLHEFDVDEFKNEVGYGKYISDYENEGNFYRLYNLTNQTFETIHDSKHVLEKLCLHLPSKYKNDSLPVTVMPNVNYSSFSTKDFEIVQYLLQYLIINNPFFLDDSNILLINERNSFVLKNFVDGSSTIFKGHKGSIWGVRVLKDSQVLSWGTDLRLWDLNKGIDIESNINQGHTDRLLGVNIISRESALTNSIDGTICLWNLKSGTSKVFKGHKTMVNKIKMINKDFFLSSAFDGTLRLWNINSGYSKIFHGHKQHIYGFEILDDNKFLSWGWDKTIRLWSFNDAFLSFKDPYAITWGHCQAPNYHYQIPIEDSIPERITFQGHNKPIAGIFILDKSFLSFTRDGCMMLWELGNMENKEWQQQKKPLKTFITNSDQSNDTLSNFNVLKINNNYVLSYSNETTIRLWDVDNGSSKVYKGHTDAVVFVNLIGNNKFLSWSEDKTLRLWDIKNFTSDLLIKKTDKVSKVKLLIDNKIISYSSKNISLWSLNTNKSELELITSKQRENDDLLNPILCINNIYISIVDDNIYLHNIETLDFITKYVCPGIVNKGVSLNQEKTAIILFTSTGEYRYIDISHLFDKTKTYD